MSEVRKMKIDEFSRRLKKLIETPDSKFVFFLGAGCSISSGIPGAETLVKSWLPKLKKLKNGSEDDYELWAKQFYPKYNNKNASMFYGKVIEDLFLTQDERQREIERLTEGKDPGFGYAILAQLITNDKFCPHCNIVLTVNFDDLVADALYLYTNKKPLVISHDSLAGFIRITRTRPLIIKLHGDARLDPKNTEQETRGLADSIKRALKNLLSETGLIFIGYGGNDESIADILAELPAEALPWGIYWISDKIPNGKLGEWLKKSNAVFVKHNDFDELMLILWRDFELIHPKKDRFDKIIRTYYNTFKKLRKRIEIKINEKPEPVKEALDKATDDISWMSIELEADKYKKKDPEKANNIYKEGIKQFTGSVELFISYASFLSWYYTDYNKAERYFKKALTIAPKDTYLLSTYALFLQQVRKDYDKAEEYYKKALDIDSNDSTNLGLYAYFLENICKDYDKAEEYYKKALDIDPNDSTNLGLYADFLENICKDYDKAEEYYKKALDIDPDHETNLGYYADFLKIIHKDYYQARKYYKKALKVYPNDVNNLGNYAGFLLSRGNKEGFIHLKKAMDLCRRDIIQKPQLLECLFYQYTHSKNRALQRKSLKEIKYLLMRGVRSPGWDLSENVKRGVKDGYTHPEFLEKLSKAISDEVDIKELNNYEQWTTIK